MIHLFRNDDHPTCKTLAISLDHRFIQLQVDSLTTYQLLKKDTWINESDSRKCWSPFHQIYHITMTHCHAKSPHSASIVPSNLSSYGSKPELRTPKPWVFVCLPFANEFGVDLLFGITCARFDHLKSCLRKVESTQSMNISYTCRMMKTMDL